MKSNFLLFLMLSPLFIFAQIDEGNKVFVITPKPLITKPVAPKKLKKVSPFSNNIDFSKLPSNGSKIEIPSNLSFLPKETFENPGDKITRRMNKNAGNGSETAQVLKQNQYLGDYKSQTKFIKILCRDFGEVDGDLIKILLNGVVQGPSFYLNGDFTEIVLEMKVGFNKIDFEALNQGTSGPNTAELQIFDDKGMLISANQWNLATGFKATTVIIKD